MSKSIVKYESVHFLDSVNFVGSRAYVMPIDHPSDLVSNTKQALTSVVTEYDETTGIFETRNTVYVPA